MVSYFYIDPYGIDVPGEVYHKGETVTRRYSTWNRVATVTVQYLPPDGSTISFFQTDLDDAAYDALHKGQRVTVRYLRLRDLPNLPLAASLGSIRILPVARLAGRTAWTPLERFWHSQGGRVLNWAAAVAILLIVWRKAKWPYFPWAVGISVLAALAGIYISEFPTPTPAPSRNVLTATAKIASLHEIDELFGGSRSRGIAVEQPIQVVGLEFLPAGWKEPVVAVDLVDADSLPLKEGAPFPIQYEAENPRVAHLTNATRNFVGLNLKGLAIAAAVGIAALAACFLVLDRLGKAANRLLARKPYRRP